MTLLALLLRPLPLLTIIATGLLLRLIYPDLIEFKYDETWLVNAAYRVAFEHATYLVGQASSLGPPNGAMPIYLLAPLLRLTRDLRAISGFFVLVNLAALVLAYYFTRRYLGKIAALSMAMLYAVNPWAVYFSRKIWLPDLLPCFVILFWWGAFKVVVDQRPRYWALMLIMAACIIQIHLSGVMLLGITLLLMLLFPRLLRPFPILTGILSFGLIFLSYGIWIADNMAQLIQQANQLFGRQPTIDDTAVRFMLDQLSGSGIEGITGDSYRQYLDGLINFSPLYMLEYIVFGSGVLLLIGQVFRGLIIRKPAALQRQAKVAFLLLLWAAVPILFYTRHSMPVTIHYLLIQLPIQFIITSYAIQAILRFCMQRVTHFWAQSVLVGTAVTMIALVLAGIYTSIYTYQFIDHTSVATAFGIPYGYYRQAIARAQAYLAEGKRVYILSHYNYPAIEYLAGYDPRLAPFDDQNSLAIPESGAVYITVPGSPQRDILAGIAREEPPVRGPSEAETFHIYQIGPAARAQLLQSYQHFQPVAEFKNGLALEGYSVTRHSNTLMLFLVWRVNDAHATKDEYTVFVHLLDTSRELKSQSDRPFALHSTWQNGDTIISQYTLQLPPGLPAGQYTLFTGIYLPTGAMPRVPIQAGSNTLPGDTLPIVTLAFSS